MLKRTLAVAALVVATIVGSLALVPATAGAAGPWFVAKTGNDANSCLSAASPCLTIQAAHGKASPGDTINVADGTYDERLGITKAVTITATNPGAVVINGATTPATAGQTVAVALPAANQVATLAGVHITGGGGNQFGGGILAFTGTTVLNNVVVRNNGTTADSGGGAFVWPGATLTMNGGQLRENTAGLGGGVYTAGTATSGSTTFPGGVANLNGVLVNDNLSTGGVNKGNGGAAWNSGTLNVTGSTFNRNRVVAGGGISGIGGVIISLALDAEDTPVTNITDTVINNGVLPVTTLNATFGGAIASLGNLLAATDAAADVLTLDGVTIDGHRAALGGAIYMGGKATITDSTISNNTVTTAANTFGGGIHVQKNPVATGLNPDLTLVGTTVSSNTANQGGGIAAGLNTKVTIGGNSKLTGNTAVNGGGIHSLGDTTIDLSLIGPLNTASFQGAGIYAGSDPGAKLTIADSAVAGNTAANVGGGLLVLAPTPVTVTGSTFSTNTAGAGGGVFLNDDVAGASFSDTDFTGNTATGANLGGGGLWNSGSSTTVTRGTFSGNTAPAAGAGGGAIITTSLTNGASAVNPRNVRLAVTDASFTGNNATLAGAVYNGGLVTLPRTNVRASTTLSGATITGSTSTQGPALLQFTSGAGSTARAHLERSTVHGNTTTNAASGAIALFNNTSLSIAESTITENTQRNIVQQSANLVSVSGSILAATAPAVNCGSAVLDGGRNLVSVNGLCGLSLAAPKSNVVAAADLGPLANNGGPTQTRNPNPSSPAINQILVSTVTGQTNQVTTNPITLCAPGSVDQRGVSRPQGIQNLCDVGSVEANVSAPTIGGATELDYQINVGIAPEAFTSTGVPTPAMQPATGVPAGLMFSPSGSGGTLTGIPMGPAGEYTMTLTSTNSEGSDTHEVTINITEAPQLTGPSAFTFTVGQLGTTAPVFQQTAGHPQAAFSVDGDLPDGVDIQDNGNGTAVITGTPAEGMGAVYNVTIVADNGVDPPAELAFALTVNEAPEIEGNSADTVGIGEAVNELFESDGYPQAELTIDGDLPDGVTFTDNGDGTATIAGAPLDGEGGEYPVTITASNDVAPDATHEFTLTVTEAPGIEGASVVAFVETVPGSTGYTTTGFPAADLSAEGTLPPGITFDDHGDGTATLGGTPTSAAAGVYNIVITASNGIAPDATLEVEITVADHVAITTTALPNGSVAVPYVAQVEYEGGLPTYSLEVTDGSLPAGLSMSTSGAITGTPTGPEGTSTFTVTITDGSDPTQTDSQELSITIGKAPTVLIAMPVLITATNILGIKINVGYVSANLRGGTPLAPLGDQTIVFKAGATTVCTGVTQANGNVVCAMGVTNTLLTILNGGVTAYYAGTPSLSPAQASAGLIGV